LIAIGLLALLPLAALLVVTLQLVRTTAPQGAPTIAIGALGSGDDQLGLAPLRRAPWMDGVTSSLRSGRADPIDLYVATRGIAPTTVSYSIAPGDTLLSVLADHQVRGEDAQAFIAALRSAGLRSELKMRPRQNLTLDLGGAITNRQARPLLGGSLRLGPERRADVDRDSAGAYHATIAFIELTRREVSARGVITQSLAADAAEAGVSYPLIAKFADIFAFDVDFQRDIQPDDSFEVYYAQYVSPDGEVDATKGEILFSRLSFNGKVKAYYRYASADGTADYYDAAGKSARTFLMRTPIEGARISSRFGMRRHPVLDYSRMHKGVDFAAPSGTKIYAAGSGVIKLAGLKSGYGKYIRIRHDSGYETAYGHMKALARGIRPGVRVAQGQVIGFVGMTGLATGPHLHYEVLQRGAQINPLSVKVPTGRKLAGLDLERFHREVERIDLSMRVGPAGQFASNAPPSGRAR
jgi:murein DD-endopeptidase MepM/ murein hydrolase activator NlpD